MTSIRSGSNHDGQPVTAASFIFRQSTTHQAQRRARPLASHTRRGQRRKRPAAAPLAQLTDNGEDESELSHDEECRRILEGLTVYIDKAVVERQRLSRRALALGANVADDMHKTVTHIVHSPSTQTTLLKGRHPRLVNYALEHNIRVISPAWLAQCHTQRKRLSERYFPYDVDPRGHLGQLQHDNDHDLGPDATEEEDNPFQLAWDELVSSDDERQTTTTTETESQSQRENELISTQSDEVASLPIPEAEEEARLQRKKKRSAEIAKLLEIAREQQRQRNGQEEEESDEEQSLPVSGSSRPQNSLPGEEERLEIWYGEQSFYCDSQPVAAPPSLPAKPRRPSTRKATTTPLKKPTSSTRKSK